MILSLQMKILSVLSSYFQASAMISSGQTFFLLKCFRLTGALHHVSFAKPHISQAMRSTSSSSPCPLPFAVTQISGAFSP